MGESRPPPFVICHLCGRKYGTKSIGIHVPQCEKKWHSENKKLPKNLRRRRLPSQPDYGKIQAGDYSADVIDQMNEMSFKAAQAQLIPCENCGRTFYPEKLPVHQKSCTVDKPARPPRGTTATSSRSPPKTAIRNQSSRVKQHKPSANNNQVNMILCAICMKQIPREKIQTHLVSCNEEKIKCMLTENSKDDEDTSPEQITRPSTRIIHRGPHTKDNNDNDVAGALTADDKDGTYDILKPSASYTVDKTVIIDNDFFPCDLCNRKFTQDRITQHKIICSKLKSKERKTFDSSKQRLQGIEFHNRNSHKKQSDTTPKSDWRLKHEEFIQSIKAAKQLKAHIAKGGKVSDIPPPPPSLNPDYVHCQYCDRRFNPEVAARHIPKCATTKNRPAPPKKKALDVYKKETKSKGVKKSETFSVRRNSADKAKGVINGNSSYPFTEIKGSNQSKQKRNGNDCSGYVSPRIENRYDSFESIPDKKNNNFRSFTSMSNYNNSDSENSCKGKSISKKTSSSHKNNAGYSYNAVKRKSPPRTKNFVF